MNGREATPVFESAEPVQFKLAGKEFTAYPPTSGQFLLMSAAIDSKKSSGSISAFVDFFFNLVDEDEQEVMRDLLTSRTNPIDFELIREILEWLMEQWSEHPTGSPQGSRSLRRTTGTTSTAKPRSKASI